MVKKGGATQNNNKTFFALAITRLLLGFVFLWAFFDKLWGLGYATPAAKAWVNGGQPTTGFLIGASKSDGPFADFFGSLAGLAWVDWLFMLGLFGIGVALLLGIGLRVAALAGVALLILMWAASLPLDNNPLIDDHLVYAIVVVAVAFAQPRLSVASWWRSLSFVKNNRWLW